MPTPAQIDALACACDFLIRGDAAAAASSISTGYPFAPGTYTKPKRGRREAAPAESAARKRSSYRKDVALRIFVRDGFVDRYFGGRLFFPPVIRVLSYALPEVVPFVGYGWPEDRTHPAFWQATPALDHIIPFCRDGADTEENFLSTSYEHNEAKNDCTPEEMGWSILPPGDVKAWDGYLGWFLDYVKLHDELVALPDIRVWHQAAKSTFTGIPLLR